MLLEAPTFRFLLPAGIFLSVFYTLVKLKSIKKNFFHGLLSDKIFAKLCCTSLSIQAVKKVGPLFFLFFFLIVKDFASTGTTGIVFSKIEVVTSTACCDFLGRNAGGVCRCLGEDSRAFVFGPLFGVLWRLRLAFGTVWRVRVVFFVLPWSETRHREVKR